MDNDDYARNLIRLALIIHALIPEGTEAFAEAVARSDELRRTVTDAELDQILTTHRALRLLIGPRLADSLATLPPDVRYADVLGSGSGRTRR